MKKTFKKSISLLIVLVMLLTTLLIAPMNSAAADAPTSLESKGISIWADPENVLSQEAIADFSSGNNNAALGGIQPHPISSSSSGSWGGSWGGSSSSTTYYLFLPSNADLSALTFWFDGTASINGTALTSGEPTNAFESINAGGVTQDATFNLNGTNYTVTVIKSGEVGTVYIDTNSGSLKTITNSSDHSDWEAGTIMVVQPNGTVDYMGVMDKMSGRGNGTWDTGNVKNPYNIKLAKSTSLLGMNAAKKWCLLANVNDGSLVKNQLTYDFAKYIGIKYQPVCKPVDLYVNQQYLGSYQLSEKVEIKSNRINVTDAYENLEIANGTVDPLTGAIIPADLTGTAVETTGKLTGGILGRTDFTGHNLGAYKSSPSLTEPSDYTGGYLYELEISNRWVNENAGFCAFNRQGWVIKSADYASTNMIKYSYDLLYALGSSVYNNGTVPSTSITTNCSSLTGSSTYGTTSVTNPAPATQYWDMNWSDLLDADSAVRYYWTQEFFKNMDSSTSSTYFYKDSDTIDPMLYAGPMWDMDNSIGYGQSGSRWGSSWTSSTGWYTKNTRIYRWRSGDSSTSYSTDRQSPLSFYGALATNCTDFWSMAEKYWYMYIEPAVQIIMGNEVDETGTLKSAKEYIDTVAKSGIMDALRFDSSYDANYHTTSMTQWFNERTNWINEQIPRTDIGVATIGPVLNQYYTGSEITPGVDVSRFITGQGTITLIEGLDYELMYKNNIDVGIATITINGIGLYTGSISKNFSIIQSNISNYTLTIPDEAYVNMELSAVLTNTDGKIIDKSLNYQWYRNGTAIDGATSSTYITTADDANTQLTVVATGDNVNLNSSVTSNACMVNEGERPVGYTKTIASWNYDHTLDSEALVTTDPTGETYYYRATDGEHKDTADLYASVNATDIAKIKWSGSADLYDNDSNSVVSDEAPIMGTSKADALAWGEYPYFETSVSTTGFELIKFSAKLGGTKKAPRDWKLQYSLDGEIYTDISNTYSIAKNKTMELAFDDVELPTVCDNQPMVYIRMVVASNVAINGSDAIVNQVSGDAAVNNIKVTGASLAEVTELYEPTITGTQPIYDDSEIVITDNNGGADVFYIIDGGDPVLYTDPINPFDPKTAKVGDTVTIEAYALFEDIMSPIASKTFTFGGVDIINFTYETFSTDVIGGAVASTGGVYDKSGRMTAYADGNSQYVPLWRDNNGSFCIAPDDGAKWSSESGFTYRVSTAGYENINFSCMAYTTNSGPKSVTLQYSKDGINFYNVDTNVELTANGKLEQAFLTTKLPVACDNLAVLYIRLATTENLTFSGEKLHKNESKGNLYVNNVIIAGEDDGTYKMPYTNKSTDYFGKSGVIEYYSPDNAPMMYAVVDSNDNIVQSGSYPQGGIQLSTVDGFANGAQEAYTVIISAIEDEDSSAVNRRTYYYKGDTVVKFNYNNSSKLFADYVSDDLLSVSSTSGANKGTLSMYPNETDATLLDYTGTYGVKVAWSETNPYVASKKLDNPKNNGYWLIETSTLGYRNLTLNLEQLSSNKGPRDWGIAYSLDGKSYTYVENSNARAISNDASSDTVETYGNLPLPAECSNQEKLYIKVFINGGESVDGTELDLVTKGNTGINAIEISGTPITSTVTVKSTVLETPEATTGNIAFEGVNVYIDGDLKGTTDAQGEFTIELDNNKSYEITLSKDGIVDRTITKKISGDGTLNIPVLVFDVNDDGYVNAKDYAMISKDSKYDGIKQFFENFINFKTSEFTYK
ncbi:MAG: CotH kinase family protein [Eubacterium sp.]|nr:CotH kinase family protein [Eubacterium sp.]